MKRNKTLGHSWCGANWAYAWASLFMFVGLFNLKFEYRIHKNLFNLKFECSIQKNLFNLKFEYSMLLLKVKNINPFG